MGLLFRGRRRAACAALLLASLFSIGLLRVPPAQAQGGFALSGSFYAQEFELPQGSRLASPEVYVVAFNNTGSALKVRMTTEAPLGVALLLSEDDFQLAPGEQRKVQVGIEVTPDAAPGEYEIRVTAEPYREGTGGIQIIGAAGQSARLVVAGAAARARVQIVSPEGTPVQGVVRLFKLLAGKRYEVAYSETGSVEATVAPGSYAAAAYIAGEKLAEESFELAADEEKTITLTVRTIYFEGFGVVPSYRTGTRDLAFAQLIYTVKNLYKPVDTAEILLRVRFDGTLLDEVPLATLSPLEMGRVGLSYNYIPADGWETGTYGFQLELRLESNPYATTAEERLDVSVQADGSTAGAKAVRRELILVVVMLAGAVAAGILLLITRRRKRQERRTQH